MSTTSRFRWLFLVLLLGTCLSAAPDPRPGILVLGDGSSSPFRSSAGWPALLALDRPDWNVIAKTQDKWTLAEWSAQAESLLADLPPVAVLLVCVGTVDSSPGTGALVDSEAAFAALLDKVAVHPSVAGARKILATPVPVVEARLDKWSLERFGNGGEARSRDLAAAQARIAAAKGWQVEGLHAWIVADVEHEKPGRLLGSTGWVVSDWGHGAMAGWMRAVLEAADPRPADPAAFAAWQKESAARADLMARLAATSGGVVDAIEPAAPVADLPKGIAVDLPADWLAGPFLDLVVSSGDTPYAVVGHDGNLPAHRSTLTVKTPDGEVKLPVRAAMMRLIDEARPDGGWQNDRFSFNAGKMNTFAVTSAETGARRWVLLRFDLSSLAGKTVASAQLSFLRPTVEIREGQTVKGSLPGTDIGAPAVRRMGPWDRDWIPAKATWKTRDGKSGWTGGTVDAVARQASLREFLAQNPPESVARQARGLLGEGN